MSPQGTPHRGETLRVEGLNEFLKAVSLAEKKTKKAVRDHLRAAADIVRVDASHRFSSISAKSAAGYRTIVRARGISVEQSLKRSKNAGLRRPNWSVMQLGIALDPAIEAKGGELEDEMGKAIEGLADIVEGRGLNP